MRPAAAPLSALQATSEQKSCRLLMSIRVKAPGLAGKTNRPPAASSGEALQKCLAGTEGGGSRMTEQRKH